MGETVHDPGSDPVSAWSFKEGWQLNADWGVATDADHLRADDAFLPWPAPLNSGDIFPDDPDADWAYTGVAEVTSNGMLDVGVLASYAHVPDNPLYPSLTSDLVIVTGVNDPFAFPSLQPAYAYALSQTITEFDGSGDPHTYTAGGNITPGSVDIALSVQAERFLEAPATSALPIYVVWENDSEAELEIEEYDGWWIAAVTVGSDGSIALYDGPRRLDFIPYGSYVSVASRLEPDGDEVVELAWAEVPNGPNCGGTTSVTWYHAISIEGGDFHCPNQACNSGSGFFPVGATIVDTDPAYRFCVGGSAAGGHAINVASPRPEIGFNDLGDMDYGHQRRFLAYPRIDEGTGYMRIVVKRDLFVWGDPTPGSGVPPEFDWELVFASSAEGDAFAPALHISPGRMEDLTAFPFLPLDTHTLAGVLYRQADSTGTVSIFTAHSNESGEPLTWAEELSSLSDWTVTAPFEFRQGLTAVPRCMDSDQCFSPPATILWFGAWTDERDVPIRRIFGGTYENN